MSKTAHELGFIHIVTVTLDKGVKKTLDYGVPTTCKGRIEVGSRVLVPVRTTLKPATVIDVKGHATTPQVRPIEKLLFEKPLLSAPLFTLAKWMSNYYTTPLSKVIKMMLPSSAIAPNKEKKMRFVRPLLPPSKLRDLIASLREKKRSQATLLDALLPHPEGLFEVDLLKLAGTSASPLKTLTKQNILAVSEKQVLRSPLEDVPFFKTAEKLLTDEQQQTFNSISDELEKGPAHTHLLFGVTGSGKTEVYLRLIKKARDLNKGVILLVPEIALTSQIIERVKTRFDEKIGILHHKLSSGEKHDMWHQIQQGHIQIVIGARSAIFSPIKDLGLIIVDEEQEGAFKQTDEMPCYHARDMAALRGKLEGVSVLLGSATPGLETFYNAQSGHYKLHMLSKRANDFAMPEIALIDKSSPLEGYEGNPTLFTTSLLKGIKECISKGEQVMLFLNRRGYNTSMLCTDCGHTVSCPHCELALTFYKKSDCLKCHTCDYELSPPPRQCPSCKQTSTITFKGVGTEKVERTLHALLPDVRSLRLDAEMTQKKGSHQAIYQQFLSGKADVLIGTQMIAKGLHFPKVTLVGVINTDGALAIPDFRSSEKCFSLLTQVAGRSGRGDVEGNVMIQTYLKDSPLLKAVQTGDYKAFYDEEITLRESFNYPPFCRLTKIVGKSQDESHLQTQMERIYTYLKQGLGPSFQVTPPYACGHAKIKTFFRYQIVVKRASNAFFSLEAASVIMSLSSARFHVIIDHDPQSLFF